MDFKLILMIYNVFYINELLSKVQVNNYVIILYDHACSDWSCDCDKIYNKKIQKKNFGKKFFWK